jgi:hypothetical protein
MGARSAFAVSSVIRNDDAEGPRRSPAIYTAAAIVAGRAQTVQRFDLAHHCLRSWARGPLGSQGRWSTGLPWSVAAWGVVTDGAVVADSNVRK